MITIELSNEDIEKFKLFMKHYDAINEIIDRGVFDVRNGHAMLYFSHTGHIMQTEISQVFKRKTQKNLTRNRIER